MGFLEKYKVTGRNVLLVLALMGAGGLLAPAYSIYQTAQSTWQDFKIMRNYVAQSPEFKRWVESLQQPKRPETKVE